MILGAKNDVKNDFAERLGHGIDDVLNRCRSESRFQRWRFFYCTNPGTLPQAGNDTAPLALNNRAEMRHDHVALHPE